MRVAITVSPDPDKKFRTTDRQMHQLRYMNYKQQYRLLSNLFDSVMRRVEIFTVDRYDVTPEFRRDGTIHLHASVFFNWDGPITESARLAVKNCLDCTFRKKFGNHHSVLIKPEFNGDDGWLTWREYQMKTRDEVAPLGLKPYEWKRENSDVYVYTSGPTYGLPE